VQGNQLDWHGPNTEGHDWLSKQLGAGVCVAEDLLSDLEVVEVTSTSECVRRSPVIL
jgi:hypothetical protein